ncbi:hypothetical protein G9A89_000685 [Geosiphon pyriformis]|nr:hypothetical protein G9A89_000685 [Geosiphon pyriformis]
MRFTPPIPPEAAIAPSLSLPPLEALEIQDPIWVCDLGEQMEYLANCVDFGPRLVFGSKFGGASNLNSGLGPNLDVWPIVMGSLLDWGWGHIWEFFWGQSFGFGNLVWFGDQFGWTIYEFYWLFIPHRVVGSQLLLIPPISLPNTTPIVIWGTFMGRLYFGISPISPLYPPSIHSSDGLEGFFMLFANFFGLLDLVRGDQHLGIQSYNLVGRHRPPWGINWVGGVWGPWSYSGRGPTLLKPLGTNFGVPVAHLWLGYY